MRRSILSVGILTIMVGVNSAEADQTFGPPTNLGPSTNSSANDGSPSISADGCALYFHSLRPDGIGRIDLWVTTRMSKCHQFGAPANLGPAINSPAIDQGPAISVDGLTLFFSSNRPGGHGGADLWEATRASMQEPFGTPKNLGPSVNSAYHELGPAITADGKTLFFSSNRPGGTGRRDLWVSTRTSTSEPFGPATNLGPPVNSPSSENRPSVTADGLKLVFSSDQPGGLGGQDLWIARRTSASQPFGTPVNLGSPLNSSHYDGMPGISPDGLTLFFGSDRTEGSGGIDLWQARVTPVISIAACDACVRSRERCCRRPSRRPRLRRWALHRRAPVFVNLRKKCCCHRCFTSDAKRTTPRSFSGELYRQYLPLVAAPVSSSHTYSRTSQNTTPRETLLWGTGRCRNPPARAAKARVVPRKSGAFNQGAGLHATFSHTTISDIATD
jgi:hypothetical protein